MARVYSATGTALPVTALETATPCFHRASPTRERTEPAACRTVRSPGAAVSASASRWGSPAGDQDLGVGQCGRGGRVGEVPYRPRGPCRPFAAGGPGAAPEKQGEMHRIDVHGPGRLGAWHDSPSARKCFLKVSSTRSCSGVGSIGAGDRWGGNPFGLILGESLTSEREFGRCGGASGRASVERETCFRCGGGSEARRRSFRHNRLPGGGRRRSRVRTGEIFEGSVRSALGCRLADHRRSEAFFRDAGDRSSVSPRRCRPAHRVFESLRRTLTRHRDRPKLWPAARSNRLLPVTTASLSRSRVVSSSDRPSSYPRIRR